MRTASLAGRLILICEDEPLIALDLQTALEKMGAGVVTAGTLQAAMKLAQQNELSAAVIDFQLGADRCDGLCTELSERGVPFMFYTGGTEHSLHNSDAPVVTKPATMEAIGAVLQGLMTARGHLKIGKPGRATLRLFQE